MKVAFWLGWLAAALGGAIAVARAAVGFDTGRDGPAVLAPLSPDDLLHASRGGWLRIRGIADPASASPTAVARDRAALAALRVRGFHACVLLNLGAGAWPGGVRNLPGAVLPLDLREARAWVSRLDLAYRGLVDRWEIGNETDIGFVGENPETYAAFLKACYWGGGERVLMAPLALPPGPYLEALVANDFLSYSSGFNYHYYGFAEDFGAVYRQFERALADLDRDLAATRAADGGGSTRKSLPVFLSEFGDGMLGAAASGTVRGRVRQWLWFKGVAQQLEELRIEAPMAFVLPAYLERGLSEFGLTLADVPGHERGPTSYLPQDFGLLRPAPWMSLIGQTADGGRASPALAYLFDQSDRHPYVSRPWLAQAAIRSPVVIDFVAGADTRASKSSRGYVLSDKPGRQSEGSGELRIYNFSDQAAAGRLRIAEDGVILEETRLELQPQEMRRWPVHLGIDSGRREGRAWSVAFLPEIRGSGVSRFATRFYPGATEDRRAVVLDLNFPGESARLPRERLSLRHLAADEPPLQADGRWLVTRGVTVRETAGGWQFTIADLPATTLRPAIAELALPHGFALPLGGLLSLDWRSLSSGVGASRYAGLSDAAGGLLQVQFRTMSGNLYEVWPRRLAAEAWQPYREPIANFTMSFFGRAALPWRLADNQVVALVLTFWPRALPTVVEIRPNGVID